MTNYMKLEILAKSVNEPFARSCVAAFCLPLNPTLEELSDIKTAVSEAVTNAIVHAYTSEEEKIVIICSIENNTLPVTVQDSGKGIADLAQAQEPFFTTLEEDERSGMGFTIMQTFMSSCKVESKLGEGTTVILQKKISKNQTQLARSKMANIQIVDDMSNAQ